MLLNGTQLRARTTSRTKSWKKGDRATYVAPRSQDFAYPPALEPQVQLHRVRVFAVEFIGFRTEALLLENFEVIA